MTEFVPLHDEEDGALKAGIRFCQIAPDKPLRMTLYELDGYTEYIRRKSKDIEVKPKRMYKLAVRGKPCLWERNTMMTSISSVSS